MFIALILAISAAIGFSIYWLVIKSRVYVGADLWLPRDEEYNFSITLFFDTREQVDSMKEHLREMHTGFEFEFMDTTTANGTYSLSCEFRAMPNGIRLSRLQTKVRREAERLGGRFAHFGAVFGPFEPGSL